jgi:hypothetical protein
MLEFDDLNNNTKKQFIEIVENDPYHLLPHTLYKNTLGTYFGSCGDNMEKAITTSQIMDIPLSLVIDCLKQNNFITKI